MRADFRHIIVAGVNRQHQQGQGQACCGLRTESVTGSLTETNIADKDATRAAVLDALNQAGFEGRRLP
jgi:hypothetical protein